MSLLADLFPLIYLISRLFRYKRYFTGLSSERCLELSLVNQKKFFSQVAMFKFELSVGGFVCVERGSVLHWYPSLVHFCVSPIDEGKDVCWDHFRPLFLSELDASSLVVLRKRVSTLKASKRM